MLAGWLASFSLVCAMYVNAAYLASVYKADWWKIAFSFSLAATFDML